MKTMRGGVLCVALCGVALMCGVLAGAATATQPGAGAMKIVCFGDSITGNRPGEAYLDKYVKWSDLLGIFVEGRTGASVVAMNRGFGGDKTYEDKARQTPGAANRLKKEVLDEKPEIAVILIGGNDKKATAADREVTRGNLEKIVGACKEAGVKVLLLQYAVLGPEGSGTAPASRPAGDKTWYHLAENNGMIAEVAKKMDVPTLELQTVFDAAVKTRARAELVNTADGVHLSPGGEVLVAKAVGRKLVELGWVK